MTTQIQVLTTTVVDKLRFISSLCHFHTKTGPHAQHLPHPHACMSEWLRIHNKAGTTAVYWKWIHTNPLPLSCTYLSHVGRTVNDSSFIFEFISNRGSSIVISCACLYIVIPFLFHYFILFEYPFFTFRIYFSNIIIIFTCIFIIILHNNKQ